MIKTLSVLGSTGSIGVQALEVAELMGFDIIALTANRQVNVLEEQIRKFSPKFAAVADENAAADLKIRVKDTSTKVLSGQKGVEECASIEADSVQATLPKTCLILPEKQSQSSCHAPPRRYFSHPAEQNQITLPLSAPPTRCAATAEESLQQALNTPALMKRSISLRPKALK